MKKSIIIKILIDTEKDEIGNLISFNGFENGKKIQNTVELLGLLDLIKNQEISNLNSKEVKKRKE